MEEVSSKEQRRHTNYTTRNSNNKNKVTVSRGNQHSITASGQKSKFKQEYRTQSEDELTNSPSTSGNKGDVKVAKSINASRVTGTAEDISTYSSLDEFEHMEEEQGLVRIMPAIDYIEINNEIMEEGNEGFNSEYRYNKKLQKVVKIHSVFKVPVIHKVKEKNLLNETSKNIKESIHILNSCSPFKDAYKSDAPNFMPETVKDQNLTSRIKREKARPPTPPTTVAKSQSTCDQKKENKVEGKFMYLISPQDGANIRNDTSLDSMDTDQIFMTYIENDNKSTCDEANQEFRNKQEMIENEIDRIKHNLQMPTIETEEDERVNDENEIRFRNSIEENKYISVNNKKNKTANLHIAKEYELGKEEYSERKALSTYTAKPKLFFMEYDHQADIAEAKHCNSTTGFILAPVIKFTKESEEDKYTASGVIQHKDDSIILNRLLNSAILKSFTCTPIKILSCGFEHCAVLTTFGTIATWGYGASGCLGHNSYTSYTSPKLIQNPKKKSPCDYLSNIIYIECGGYHTICIDSDYKAYSWGRGDVGQLGVYQDQLTKDKMGMVVLQPRLLEYFSEVPIVQAACGEAHSIVLDKWGRCFSFGWNQLGQLGVGKITQGQEYTIHKIFGLPPISKISCGAIFSMAICTSGKVYVWGSGENGQLALGSDIKESIIPIQVGTDTFFDQEKIIEGLCGNCHVLVLTESGKVYGWGQGIIDQTNESKTNNGDISTVIEIKSFDIHNLEEVKSCHRFLLK